MATLPDKDNDLIQFLEARVAIWEGAPSAVGLSVQQVASLRALLTRARLAYGDALAARAASKAATVTLDDSVGELRAGAGGLIRTIRAFAATTGNPGVYSAAEIDPPAPPTAARPPTQPTGLRAIIQPTGGLTIQFKPTRPAPAGTNQDVSTSGVVYVIKRKLRHEARFTIVGAVPASRGGARAYSSFTDTTLPGGAGAGGAAGGVQYVIQGQRATTTGQNLTGPESAVFTIMLGSGEADGAGGAGVEARAGMRIAA